jgi:hypothetical protein
MNASLLLRFSFAIDGGRWDEVKFSGESSWAADASRPNSELII